MKIEPSGVILTGTCDIQTAVCQALTAAPITAVWTLPGRTQINVCRACLEEQIRDGVWEVPGARVHRRLDAAVYSRNGTLVLAVEVKYRAPSHPEEGSRWAVNIHRNLIVHSGMAAAPYFLLVGAPASFYLWGGRTSHDPYSSPEYSYHGSEVLEPFQDRALNYNNTGLQYEAAVAAWLEYLATSEDLPDASFTMWLKESGLFPAIQGGTVIRQAPIAA